MLICDQRPDFMPTSRPQWHSVVNNKAITAQAALWTHLCTIDNCWVYHHYHHYQEQATDVTVVTQQHNHSVAVSTVYVKLEITASTMKGGDVEKKKTRQVLYKQMYLSFKIKILQDVKAKLTDENWQLGVNGKATVSISSMLQISHDWGDMSLYNCCQLD